MPKSRLQIGPALHMLKKVEEELIAQDRGDIAAQVWSMRNTFSEDHETTTELLDYITGELIYAVLTSQDKIRAEAMAVALRRLRTFHELE